MTFNLKYSIALKAAQLNALSTALGSGALLQIYSGVQPATPDTAAAGSLLATLTCGSPFAPATTTATLTLNNITAGTGTAAASTGTTATWYRIVNATTLVAHVDGAVGNTASDLNLVNTSIATGQTVSVNAGATYTSNN